VESLPRQATPKSALVDVPSHSSAPEKTNLFIGAWTANLSKSRRCPDNPFRSATLYIDTVGDTLTITNIVIDSSSREEQSSNMVQVDGKEHPSGRGNGSTILARWLGSHVLEAVGNKNGQVEGRGIYEVSADGKILTISAGDQVLVLNRQ
jgi:hypothetical protein